MISCVKSEKDNTVSENEPDQMESEQIDLSVENGEERIDEVRERH